MQCSWEQKVKTTIIGLDDQGLCLATLKGSRKVQLQRKLTLISSKPHLSIPQIFFFKWIHSKLSYICLFSLAHCELVKAFFGYLQCTMDQITCEKKGCTFIVGRSSDARWLVAQWAKMISKSCRFQIQKAKCFITFTIIGLLLSRALSQNLFKNLKK